MKKYFSLIFVFLFLVTNGISGQVSNADSLRLVIRQMSGKEKAAAIQKAAFRFYQEDPEISLNFARQYEKLPDEVVSLKTKIDFFNSLSKKFEQRKEYRYALIFYKIADSLQTMKPNSVREVSQKSSGLPAAFYLFIFILL
ncbi:hypothetical protein MNBD_BACTEROID07-1357, partial [hydrothermal vent metagenome]